MGLRAMLPNIKLAPGRLGNTKLHAYEGPGSRLSIVLFDWNYALVSRTQSRVRGSSQVLYKRVSCWRIITMTTMTRDIVGSSAELHNLSYFYGDKLYVHMLGRGLHDQFSCMSRPNLPNAFTLAISGNPTLTPSFFSTHNKRRFIKVVRLELES